MIGSGVTVGIGWARAMSSPPWVLRLADIKVALDT
jgi:hypothetical protein